MISSSSPLCVQSHRTPRLIGAYSTQRIIETTVHDSAIQNQIIVGTKTQRPTTSDTRKYDMHSRLLFFRRFMIGCRLDMYAIQSTSDYFM